MKSGCCISIVALCPLVVFAAIVHCRSEDAIQKIKGNDSRHVKQVISNSKTGENRLRKPSSFNFSKYVSLEIIW